MVWRGNNVFGNAGRPQLPHNPDDNVDARDIILYALFARFALVNNETVEFRAVFDDESKIIELDIPSEILHIFDDLTGYQFGPNARAYLDWLCG